MRAVDRLLLKLARKWVRPYIRVRNGNTEYVDGYYMDIPSHGGFGDADAYRHHMDNFSKMATHVFKEHQDDAKALMDAGHATDVSWAHRILHGLDEPRSGTPNIPTKVGERKEYNWSQSQGFTLDSIEALKDAVVDVEVRGADQQPSFTWWGGGKDARVVGSEFRDGYGFAVFEYQDGTRKLVAPSDIAAIKLKETTPTVQLIAAYDPSSPEGDMVGEMPEFEVAEKDWTYTPDPNFKPSPGGYKTARQAAIENHLGDSKLVHERLSKFKEGDTIMDVETGETFTIESFNDNYGERTGVKTTKGRNIRGDKVMSASVGRHVEVLDRGLDGDGKPTYTVGITSDDGAHGTTSKDFKTERTVWEAAYRIDKSPDVKAMRDKFKSEAAKQKAKKDEIKAKALTVQSNLTPAYKILVERKITNEDVDEDMIAAALAALDLFADDLEWSDFLVDMEARVKKGWNLSPGMVRGILNALKKNILKHQEGRAAFEMQAGLTAAQEHLLTLVMPIPRP